MGSEVNGGESGGDILGTGRPVVVAAGFSDSSLSKEDTLFFFL